MVKLTIFIYAAAAGVAGLIVASGLIFFATYRTGYSDNTTSQSFDTFCHLQHFLTNVEGDCNGSSTTPSPLNQAGNSVSEAQQDRQDSYLRGAVSFNSPYGKQLSEENKKFLCGDSVEKITST